MIRIDMETIDKSQITKDVFLITQEILKGCTNERAEEVKETLHQAPTLSQMKSDLDMYNKIAQTLSDKIKEEEARRKKDTNHLIEKRVRTTTINDEILTQTNKNGFKTKPKNMKSTEAFTYRREGNKVVCIIDTPIGRFSGSALQHEDDKFNYESGMTLAMLRARKQQYTQMEKELAKSL